ncbi:putative glycerophosphocholine phosphodiesterase GPCPD1 homolog 2 [Clytia hemisphaerica]|uniref:GP-PDE domain-containing protein n=1 Tax=Clytia hemisphaerica TaxID=252671 RepID=A0A7M5XFY0_9CNID
MVLLHFNLHASQSNPIKLNDDEEGQQFSIKLRHQDKAPVLKKFNTEGYEDIQSEEAIPFDPDFYYTFIFDVDDLSKIDIECELTNTKNETIGTAHFTKPSLHEEVFGTCCSEITKDGVSIGKILFNYLVLPSKITHDLSTCGTNTKSDTILDDFHYIGHRGDGSTKLRTLPYLENTISSFIRAHELGASFVELDVQLTKDHVPVVFHDDFVAVISDKDNRYTVDKVPVKDLTLSEIRNKKVDFARPDAGLNYDDRFKHLFPTLKELLEETPSTLGLFMEIKYPEPDQGITDLIPKHIVVDRILDVMSESKIKQPIMFCSFDPEICIMLKHKQASFPVFFITNGENCFTSYNPFEPYDMRTRTRMIAAHFAICHDLKGISINSDPLMNSRDDYAKLTAFLKEHSKMLFSWGSANCDREYANIQKSVKMAGVISDRLANLNITRNA